MGPSVTQARDSWTLNTGVAIGFAIAFIPLQVSQFLIGGLMDDRGFNAVQAGTLSTIEVMAVAGAALVAALFMSRRCVVRVGIGGTLIAGLAQLGSTLPDSFWWLAAARLAAGIGSGLVVAAVAAAAASARSPDRLYGFATAGFAAIMIGLYPALAASIDAMGIAAGYGLLGVLFLLGLPFLRGLGRGSRGVVISRPKERRLPRGELALLLALIGTLGLGIGPLWGFMERIGMNLGIGAERLGVIFSVSQFAAMGGALLAGALGARCGRRGPLALALAVLGIVCLGFGFVSGAVSYVSLVLLCLLLIYFLWSFLFAIVAIFDPVGRVGPAAIGWWMLLIGLGPALGGVLVTAGSYAALGWFALGVCGLGALLALLFGRPLNRLGATSAPRHDLQHGLSARPSADPG